MEITIELVNVNGTLRGRRFQDRWNLWQLQIIPDMLSGIPTDRNHTKLRKIRKEYGQDFKFAIIRNGKSEGITERDREAFGWFNVDAA